jgi:hypothetical protein
MMKAVTNIYLFNKLHEIVSSTIALRRNEQFNYFLEPPLASGAEVEDFILSIPYFDEELKNFIAGNLQLKTFVIDNIWEADFILRAELWAQSNDWIRNNLANSVAKCIALAKANADRLSLPY